MMQAAFDPINTKLAVFDVLAISVEFKVISVQHIQV
jgi:hypothetical protein